MYSKKGLFIRALLFLLWFGLLLFLVDGLGYFPVLAEKLGYPLTEALLWALVLLPAIPLARYTWRYLHRRGTNGKKPNAR